MEHCSRPIIIGLTGGIASGKTTVSDLFAQQGITIIDADVIGHQLVQPGQAALLRIIEVFGAEMLTQAGELDRAALRAKVFNDKVQRQQLEAILHPLIRQTMYQQAEQLDAPYCIFSIPLLVETQQYKNMDRVLVVDCDVSLQRQRLAQRNGFNDSEIDAILNAQTSSQQRLAIADDVIKNNKDTASLVIQVQQLHQYYLAYADNMKQQRK